MLSDVVITFQNQKSVVELKIWRGQKAHEKGIKQLQEVRDGLKSKDGIPLCNGLISDWAGWQKENGETYQHLCDVLACLSPSEQEKLTPGKLTRISLDDARDIPTLKMPYNTEVPVLHASAGMKRIISMVYLLVWAWDEHLKASKLLGQKTTSQVVGFQDN